VQRLPHGVVERVVHRVDGTGVVEREAGVFGERNENVALGFGVHAAGAMRRDHQAAGGLPLEVHGRGHRCLQPVVGERADRAVEVLIGLGDAETVLGDGAAPDPGADWESKELIAKLRWDADGRDHHHHAGVPLVEQAQTHNLVAEKLGGAVGDGVQHLLERRAGGDLALDAGELLEQRTALT
jgi:hypothetical protein